MKNTIPDVCSRYSETVLSVLEKRQTMCLTSIVLEIFKVHRKAADHYTAFHGMLSEATRGDILKKNITGGRDRQHTSVCLLTVLWHGIPARIPVLEKEDTASAPVF